MDLGSGTGLMTKILKNNGHIVVPLDVQNKSYFKDTTPNIYNGEKLPYRNNTFDVCIIFEVLHHTKSPEKLVSEAKRVAKKIIILEDLIENNIQSYISNILDRILNFEFQTPPHNNKTDNEWRK